MADCCTGGSLNIQRRDPPEGGTFNLLLLDVPGPLIMCPQRLQSFDPNCSEKPFCALASAHASWLARKSFICKTVQKFLSRILVRHGFDLQGKTRGEQTAAFLGESVWCLLKYVCTTMIPFPLKYVCTSMDSIPGCLQAMQ